MPNNPSEQKMDQDNEMDSTERSRPESMGPESRPLERAQSPERGERIGARGTAAMDPETRKEVARKGGLAVSRNKQHMAEIGRKGGQSVSKNRDHMASIGRKGGAASRGHRGGSDEGQSGGQSGTA